MGSRERGRVSSRSGGGMEVGLIGGMLERKSRKSMRVMLSLLRVASSLSKVFLLMVKSSGEERVLYQLAWNC